MSIATKKPPRKSKPTRPETKPLPLNCLVLMTRADVCEALRCGESHHKMMVSKSEYPKPSLVDGKIVRWSSITHNDYIMQITLYGKWSKDRTDIGA